MKSSLTTRSVYTNKRSTRAGVDVDHFIIHGAASTSLNGVVALMLPTGGRQVSANYVIKDDEIVCVVPEEYRAWTSGSPYDNGKGAAWDRRSITVEVVNSGGSKAGWPFSDESVASLAKLIADVSTRHKFVITDNSVLTHQELWKRFRASYPTACPQSLQGRKAEVLKKARVAQAADAPAGGGASKPPAKPTKPAAAVKTLQARLNKYAGAKLVVDGIKGPKTTAAIKAFQEKHGLVVDGIWGPKSQAKLVAVVAASRRVLERGDTGAQVKLLQRKLGLTADGIFGPKTLAGVKAFQRKHKLVADGIVGPKTWGKLGI